jgi:hypothetical protein
MDIDVDLIKEVYARFGLAYYLSECLHRELANGLVMLTFSDPAHITRPRLEEKFAHAFSMTFGQIVQDLAPLLPTNTLQRLHLALQKRNFLAHHFWYERSHLMVTNEGLSSMVRELAECAEFFQEVDREVTSYCLPHVHALGITEDHLTEAFQEILQGIPPDPLPSRPIPRRSQRVQIIRAWDIPSTLQEGGSGLIFEAADRQFWQLCDVGLGWFLRDEPEPHWVVNSALAQYLPAVMPARPSLRSPWDFDLPLARGAVLRVRPPSGNKIFRWSIVRSQESKPGVQTDS